MILIYYIHGVFIFIVIICKTPKLADGNTNYYSPVVAIFGAQTLCVKISFVTYRSNTASCLQPGCDIF